MNMVKQQLDSSELRSLTRFLIKQRCILNQHNDPNKNKAHLSLQKKVNKIRAFSPTTEPHRLQLLTQKIDLNSSKDLQRRRKGNYRRREEAKFLNICHQDLKKLTWKQTHLILIDTCNRKVREACNSRFSNLTSPKKLRNKLKEGALWFKSMSPDQRTEMNS
jgi:hypothetical protein